MQKHRTPVGCARLCQSGETNIAEERTRLKCRFSLVRDLRLCTGNYCQSTIFPCFCLSVGRCCCLKTVHRCVKMWLNRKKSTRVECSTKRFDCFQSPWTGFHFVAQKYILPPPFFEGSISLICNISPNTLKSVRHIGFKNEPDDFAMRSLMIFLWRQSVPWQTMANHKAYGIPHSERNVS